MWSKIWNWLKSFGKNILDAFIEKMKEVALAALTDTDLISAVKDAVLEVWDDDTLSGSEKAKKVLEVVKAKYPNASTSTINLLIEMVVSAVKKTNEETTTEA